MLPLAYICAGEPFNEIQKLAANICLTKARLQIMFHNCQQVRPVCTAFTPYFSKPIAKCWWKLQTKTHLEEEASGLMLFEPEVADLAKIWQAHPVSKLRLQF